jgi:dipeptidyl-peptidase-4
MKRTLLAAGALLACFFAYAQNRVIDTRPAHGGKDLTLEDVVLKGMGYSRIPRDKAPSRPFPPKGRLSLFSDQGSLFVRDAKKDTVICMAQSPDPGTVYGEIVSRNEFGINAGWYVSPDSTQVAFYKKDQSRVSQFPLLNIKTRTGDLRLIYYPMNGMASEVISVGIYTFATGQTVWLDVKDFNDDRYITNLAWSPDAKSLYAQVLDRSQHHMRLNQYRTCDGTYVRTVLTEDNDAWIEPLDPVWFIKGRKDRFLYRTDNRDGYRNLYVVDTLGKSVSRLTQVDADVEYVGNDGKFVYYTSAQVSPVENHLFKIDLKKGKAVDLTPERGWHNIYMDPDLQWFNDTYTNASTPVKLLIRSTSGKTSQVLYEAPDPLEEYNSCQVELGTVPSADGQFENYYRLIYPKDFDPAKKYPVILYVYGGPHSQMVQDSWLGQIRMWEMYMAQKGYLVYVQDNRGTQNRGAAFEKAINRQCGKAEMEDQMVGINWLRSLPYVDASRIGVHGWSYGGFMTISLLTTYPDVFKVGVAGGPVIDWKWYEIMYGERYMDNPQTNPEGFESTSLINKAKNLKGKLLICQGAVDETVVWEHSLSFIQQCIDLDIPVDYFPYPVAQHNVAGRNRLHLMDKITQYFEDYL